MSNIIDLKSYKRKRNTVNSKKPNFTPEEIQKKTQPYIDYLNKPNKVFVSKKGDRWTTEENEQFKRLVFKYTVECYSCTAMAEEIKKFFPWRTKSAILRKISEVRQNCYEELENFYTVVNYGGVVVRDAKLHYSPKTGIQFGCYLHERMLQMAGLIEGPEIKENEKSNKKLIERIERGNIAKQKALDLFKFREKKKLQEDISYKEAAELLDTTAKRIEEIAEKMNIGRLNTRHLLGYC